MKHRGDCHCGRIQFEFECDSDIELLNCNCSICHRSGFLHLITPTDSFKLLCDWDDVAVYTFNTHVAKHYFCPVCGVKPFYVPRSHPEGLSINFRCVDASEFNVTRIQDFDGQNWEDNISELKTLDELAE